MEYVSLQTAEQIFRDCRGIGERLEQPALVRLAKQAEAELQRASGLRVAFITGNLAVFTLCNVFNTHAYAHTYTHTDKQACTHM